MKKIEAVVRPSKLEDVKDALAKYGVKGMTVTEVIGCGLQKGKKEVYRGTEYSIDLLPKIKIEVVVQDKWEEEVIRVLINASRSGEIGDGKIFVYSIDKAVRIRTGETGEDAI